MKTIRLTALFALALAIFAASVDAQRRTRRPAPKPTPKPTPAVNTVVANAKHQVSNQLHNVKVFVDRMGPIAVGIENADRDAAARKLKQSDIAVNEANKKKVVAAIRALQEGLVALETDFRTKPQLAAYLPKIQGITSLCAQSEDQAIAGKFVASKDPLRDVILKLNDTLAVMPGPMIAGRPTTTPVRPQPVSNQPVSNRTTITVPSASKTTSSTAGSTSTSAKREPAVGMTPDDVLASTWGAPTSKRNSKSANGTTEVWVYSDNRTIYFFNGKVSQIIK
jgi:hypothetical protein